MSGRIVYADSSALVKLIVEEDETSALERELSDEPTLVSSALARVASRQRAMLSRKERQRA